MLYTLGVVFTCTVCFFTLVVTLFNIYLNLRRRFPVKVNCWFCNNWTKVEYDNQNSFECPTCLQYNGFTKDGSYNRYIPEQHDNHLNQKLIYNQKRSSPLSQNSSNGRLCTTCNYNQELKVFQLANFVPLVEKNYDVEVEHFQKQLEKAYGLCKRCENVLEKTLQAQSLKMFGNRIRQIQREAVSLLDLSKPYKGTPKIPFFIKFIHYSIVIFAALMLVNTVVTLDYSDGHLKKLLPQFLFHTARRIKLIFNGLLKNTEDLQREINPILQTMSDHCNKFSDEVAKLSTNLWDRITEQDLVKHCLQQIAEKVPNFSIVQEKKNHLINYTFTAISGLFLQLILCFWNKNKTVTKASQVISWIVLALISSNRLHGKYELLQLFLEVFCPLLIMCTMSRNTSDSTVKTYSSHIKTKKKRNIRKLVKKDVSSDLSDCDDCTENLEKVPSFNTALDSTQTAQLECDTAKVKNTLPHNNLDTDLNASLSNLDLGSNRTVFNNSTSKPLVSPSKLNSITKNPWTAGGFWNNPYSWPEPVPSNLSRSSSHSSGFGSHTNENLNFNSLPASPGNSVSGGDDQQSVFSEPPYHLGNAQFELYKARNGAIAASFYSPTTGSFRVRNPFEQTMGGMLWNKHEREINGFSYAASTVNLNWPLRNGYSTGNVFKNLGNPVKMDSFSKIRN